jgi:hypothetical protein
MVCRPDRPPALALTRARRRARRGPAHLHARHRQLAIDEVGAVPQQQQQVPRAVGLPRHHKPAQCVVRGSGRRGCRPGYASVLQAPVCSRSHGAVAACAPAGGRWHARFALRCAALCCAALACSWRAGPGWSGRVTQAVTPGTRAAARQRPLPLAPAPSPWPPGTGRQPPPGTPAPGKKGRGGQGRSSGQAGGRAGKLQVRPAPARARRPLPHSAAAPPCRTEQQRAGRRHRFLQERAHLLSDDVVVVHLRLPSLLLLLLVAVVGGAPRLPRRRRRQWEARRQPRRVVVPEQAAQVVVLVDAGRAGLRKGKDGLLQAHAHAHQVVYDHKPCVNPKGRKVGAVERRAGRRRVGGRG